MLIHHYIKALEFNQLFNLLLALLVKWPCFRLISLIALIVGLAIDEAELMGEEVVVGFSG